MCEDATSESMLEHIIQQQRKHKIGERQTQKHHSTFKIFVGFSGRYVMRQVMKNVVISDIWVRV